MVKKFPGHTLRRFDRPLYLGDGDVQLRSGREAVEAEISILRLLGRAKHVVHLLDVAEISDQSLELRFSWVGEPVMRWTRDGYTEISDPREVLRQTLAGVAEIHEAGIVHKDLKPENILLSEIYPGRMHIAVCDFGSAVMVDKKFPIIHDAHGTLEFTPPEILVHGRGDGFLRDAWSIGIFFFALLTRRLPWKQRTEAEIISTAISRPEGVSDDAWALLEGLTSRDVDQRWSIARARDCSYLLGETQ